MKVIDKHIRLNSNTAFKIECYAKEKAITFNKALIELIESSFDKKNFSECLDKLENKITKVYYKQKDTLSFLEQMYSDFEFDNITDPRLSKALNELKERQRRNIIND